MPATHPSDRELDDFLLGKFPDPDHAVYEAHLAGCPTCQDRAADRSAFDTLTELLAAARTRADADQSAADLGLDGAEVRATEASLEDVFVALSRAQEQ